MSMSEAVPTMRHRAFKASLSNPFLSEDMVNAFVHIKRQAGGMDHGVVKLCDAVASSMDVVLTV